MNNKEDWVLRPVLRGLCRYESLINGALNIVDIARMNEALDVEDFNSDVIKRAT